MKQLSIEDGRNRTKKNGQLLVAAPATAAASVPPPAPPTTIEPVPKRRICSAIQGRRFHDGDPPAAWPKIATARGLTGNSAKGQIKRKLDLNATAKPRPEPAYKVRKAAGKAKAVESLAAKWAAVGAGNDTDHSEGRFYDTRDGLPLHLL
ncbi:hypothetical protein DL770_000502 [Monosporascus sp. CRB-9-2]|nr:hypothetical protein DL770_000502 [Monosporascus sp. CRB-9-2]